MVWPTPRERLLAVGVVVAAVLAGADFGYRTLDAKRQLLEDQSQELRSRLDAMPASRQDSPVAQPVGNPVALMMEPSGLRLISFAMVPGTPDSVAFGLEGGYGEFISYLERLEQSTLGWKWVEVDYQVKNHPAAEIRLRLLKPAL